MLDEKDKWCPDKWCPFYGYLMIPILVVVKGVKTWGQANMLGFAMPSIQSELDLTRGVISTIFGLSTLIGAILQTPLGHLVDTHGSRLVMTMMLAVVSSGMLMLAYCTGPIGLFFSFLILRSAFVVDTATDACLTQWFKRKRGRVGSVYQFLAISIGGTGAVSLTQYWIFEVGWRGAWIRAALVTLLSAIPAWLIIRHTPEEEI